MGSFSGIQAAELVLLLVSFGAIFLLAASRRKTSGLPWSGVVFAAVGILLLALHAMRTTLTPMFGDAELQAIAIAGVILEWRWIEVLGLMSVGIGVAVLTRVADEENRRRRHEQRVAQIAPDLQASPDLLRSVLRTTPGATMLLRAPAPPSTTYTVAFADEKALELLESPPAKLAMAEPALGIFQPDAIVTTIRAAADEAVRTAAMSKHETDEPHDGRWYEISAGAHGAAVIVMISDITERRDAALALERAAFTDPVTGLANRRYFEDHLESAVTRARAHADEGFALIYIDFDHFKRINDEHGHHTGDELLISIGGRVAHTIAEINPASGEPHLAARIGGDEFVILLRENDQSRVRALAERLRQVLSEPHALNALSVTSTASVGVALCDGRQVSGAELLKNADAAMYTAKQGGKNRIHVGTPAGPDAPSSPAPAADTLGPSKEAA